MLRIQNLCVTIDSKEIVKGVSLSIHPGEIHALMGPNGSGKSSLAMSLAGHPKYRIVEDYGAPVERSPLPWSPSTRPLRRSFSEASRGVASTGFGRTSDFSQEEKSGSSEMAKIEMDGIDITNKTPDERARMGLFLAMQYPVGVDGVTVEQLLRRAKQEIRTLPKTKKLDVLQFRKDLEKLAKTVGVNRELLFRSLNVGFSGGEKKRLEILQMLALQPKYAILDETDSGLDIDALRTIAAAIKHYVSARATNPASTAGGHEPPAVLVITHYARLLKHLQPDYVHIMKEGKITETGGKELATRIEKNGYKDLNGHNG